MLTVTIEGELADQVTHLAATGAQSAESLVNEAVRRYLSERQREKIRAEEEAFARQRDTLRERYLGQYVAMHEGAVIDHDPDVRALHLRIFARLGHLPVLLKRVTDEPERPLIFRSPRLEPLEGSASTTAPPITHPHPLSRSVSPRRQRDGA